LPETFLTVGRTERDMIKNVQWALCKVTVIFASFVSYLYFLEGFLKNLSKIKVARGDAIG
jgi:hypothetical protein